MAAQRLPSGLPDMPGAEVCARHPAGSDEGSLFFLFANSKLACCQSQRLRDQGVLARRFFTGGLRVSMMTALRAEAFPISGVGYTLQTGRKPVFHVRRAVP